MQGHTTCNWMPGLCLLILFSFNLHGLGHSAAVNPGLAEGSACFLDTGLKDGVCVKAMDCPKKIMEIKARNYTDDGRCGFWKLDEIVCCTKTHRTRRSTTGSRAEAACRTYEENNTEPVFKAVVFNGVRTDPEEFPYMAALGYRDMTAEVAGEMKYLCGGTLISEKHVITAAHCVSNIQDAVPVEVVLGTTDLTKMRSELAVQRIPIAKIVKHPEYKRVFNYHDVAVVELKNPAKLTVDVQPTCLMTKPLSISLDTDPDTSLVVLGWGAIDLDQTLSPQLLKAENLNLVGKTECSESYNNVQARLPNGLDDGMLCVGDPDAKRRSETCWGDSGGPLLLKSRKFPPLVGITSFGQACGETTPIVYTSAYKYLDWIEDQVWPITD